MKCNPFLFFARRGIRDLEGAALVILVLAAGPAPAETAGSLFDARVVHDIWLTVDPAMWQTLRDNYLANTYYPAQFTWNSVSMQRVGIRSRGSGSRSPHKPNMLLSFNRYESGQEFDGLQAVILKANNQDASLLHELIAMELFRRMGLPAPREAPARLHVNGEFFGAYTLVERVDEAFLRRNLGEDAGYLYDFEANLTEGYRFEYLGPDPALYSPVPWTPANHETDPDPAPIEAMLRAINQASDTDFVRIVSEYLDLKQVMTYIAVEDFLTEFDGLLGQVYGANNIYFYRFAGTNLFHLIPWDKDGTFDWAERELFKGVDENVLSRRAMQVAELRSAYLEALVKAAAIAGGEGGWLESEIDRLYALIRDMAYADVNKQCTQDGSMHPCGPADFEREVDNMRQFARQRAGFVIREAEAAGYRPSAGAPRLLDGGAVNAASALPLLAPGSLISVFGERLASSTANAPLENPPTELAGVSLLIDGARAPLLFVSPTQINAQIPWASSPGAAPITVFSAGAIANTILAEIDDYAPGIFLLTHGASGEPVTAEQPAITGETLILYATGLGPVNRNDGTTLQIPAITIGEIPASVHSSELTDSTGLYLVRLELPGSVAAAPDAPVTLTIGGKSATVSIHVRVAGGVN